MTKTGPLTKKASKTKMNTKYWFVLRNDVLSWYESTTVRNTLTAVANAQDPYFPKGNVSLQYASSCEPIDDTRFKLRTAERSYSFAADTTTNRDDWVKAIRKVMFKVQNEGETVKLVLPLETIDDVERRDTLEFAETIEVCPCVLSLLTIQLKILDLEDSAINSYFFAYFHDNDAAFNAISKLLQERPPSAFPPRRASDTLPNFNDQSEIPTSPVKQITTKLGAILKPFNVRDKEDPQPRPSSAPIEDSTAKIPMIGAEPTPGYDAALSPTSTHSYPPSIPEGASTPRSKLSGWVRKPASKLFASSPSSQSDAPIYDPRPRPVRKATETIENDKQTPEESSDDDFDSPRRRESTTSSISAHDAMDYSMLEASETGLHREEEVEQKFRKLFALPNENLVDRQYRLVCLADSLRFPGIPRSLAACRWSLLHLGKLCLLPLDPGDEQDEGKRFGRSSKLTDKMVLPIRDIFGLKAQSAFRLGHVGLVVILKGHEELFFEFTSNERRKACVVLLENHMERLHLESRQAGNDDRANKSHASLEARILEDLDEKADFDPENHRLPPVSPSPMFSSTASTFLDFKPPPMKVTCLSIGSRGDVQPYIALCKALQAEGHSVKIASHEEYREWVVKVSGPTLRSD